MNFEAAVSRFAQGESGSDSFKLLSNTAFEEMKTDPANAAAYFLVGTIARAYVSRYEAEGVSMEFADRAKKVLVDFNEKISRSLAADPDTRWHLLSEVAFEYEWQIADF